MPQDTGLPQPNIASTATADDWQQILQSSKQAYMYLSMYEVSSDATLVETSLLQACQDGEMKVCSSQLESCPTLYEPVRGGHCNISIEMRTCAVGSQLPCLEQWLDMTIKP
jgi:hypothetical protein